MAFIFPWFYTRRRLPGPGSENIAFNSLLLNGVTPIGAGVANRAQFYGNVPSSWAPHTVGINGLGGLGFTTMYGYPLDSVPGQDQSGTYF